MVWLAGSDSHVPEGTYHGAQSSSLYPFPRVFVPLFVSSSREPIKPAISLIISELINMPRDRPDGPILKTMDERAHSLGVDVLSRAVDSRSLIKDSHAYQGIPKDQSGGIPLKFEDWFASSQTWIWQDTGLPYSSRRWSNIKLILWILFRTRQDFDKFYFFLSLHFFSVINLPPRVDYYRDKLYRNYFIVFVLR